MIQETLEVMLDEHTFALHVHRPDDQPRPAVIICHTWRGQSDFERGWAESMAEQGYVGVAHDIYGVGVRGESPEACRALMSPLIADRDELGRRLLAGVRAVVAQPWVDPARVAAIGFCFGGLCVLDLARRRAPLAGVVSVHGLFHPGPGAPAPIDARVLILHGYDDPMAPPEAMHAIAAELTEAGADWQIHAYGGTMHAFTNPEANDPERGTVYSKRASVRARRSTEAFLHELF
ncbi:MAG TPA: alpha/beta hydrolase [Deltaproteobacteria bacterium]|nr:alpha/beta hydrolase [Deltaproteobacteria bacterium]